MRIIYTSLLYLVYFGTQWVFGAGKRGPHHPKSEIDVGRNTVDKHLQHDSEHLKDDLKTESITDKSFEDMTDEEKKFYYFTLHDSDNNNALDGLELLQAATHHTSNSESDNDEDSEFNHIIVVIDEFILEADTNKDGYLNYLEYSRAMMKLIHF